MKKKTTALLIFFSLMLLMIPSVASATTTIFRDGDENLTAVNIDKIYYYDIYQGIDANRANVNNNVKFLGDVIKSSYVQPGGSGANVGMLDYWSQLAFLIFQDNSLYAANLNAGGGFAKNMGKRGDDSGYTDIVYGLQYTGAPYRNGKTGKDNTWYSGLTYAGNLAEVRQRMAQSLADSINRKVKPADFLSMDGNEFLPALNTDAAKNTKNVYYTMITCLDRQGATAKYHYNSYCLAFYDFELSILADDDLAYATAADGFESVEEAAKANAPNVSYKSSGTGENQTTSYYENGSTENSEIGMEFNQENSTTVSNSMEATESYSFSQMIGSSTEFGATLPVIGQAKETITMEFTAEQAYSTAYSETKETTKTVSNTVSTTMDLPAQTAVAIDSSNQTVTITLGYDCPVVVKFKVAIFATAGECYDDNAATQSFSTADYRQSYMSTFFGTEDGDAIADLYNRAIVCADTAGFEESLGVTNGYNKARKDGNAADRLTSLNWPNILGGAVSEDDSSRKVVVVSILVDENGNAGNMQEIASYDTVGAIGGTLTINAPSHTGYDLYTGDKVTYTDEDGTSEISNTFTTADNDKKQIVVGDDPDSDIVYFFYTVKDVDPGDGTSTTSLQSSAPQISYLPGAQLFESPIAVFDNPTKTATSGKINTLAGTNDLINWLTQHYPMSTTGGTISYKSASITANIQGIIPIYPLYNIKVTGGSTNYDMREGDVLNVDNIEINGFNRNNVPYYGFDQDKGYWMLVDENDEEITDETIAKLSVDEKSGTTKLIAGSEGGTVYLKYMISDKSNYSCKNNSKYVTNDQIHTAYITINLVKTPFEGTVHAEGTVTGYVNDDAINLDAIDEIDGYVLDKTEKQIDVPITWEAQRLPKDGIEIVDNKMTFTKAGTYKIRAVYSGQRSEWIEVTAEPQKVLDRLVISKENTNLLDDYILDDGDNNFDLSLLKVEAFNQYDQPWTDLDDLTWFCQLEGEDPQEITGSVMHVDKAGLYTIYAQCKGVKSNELTLLVKDKRGLNSFDIDYTNLIPADYTASHEYLKDNEYIMGDIINGTANRFDLSKLPIVDPLDQYGDAWNLKSSDLTWYVNGEAISGSVLNINEAGDYEIQAKCGEVESSVYTLKVLPARALASFDIDYTNLISADYTAAHEYLKDNEYVLGDLINGKANQFDLSKLTIINPLDQYGDAYALTMANLTWYVNGEAISGSVLNITEAGDYEIQAKCGEVESSVYTLKVLPARALAKIEVSGTIPTLTTNTTFNNHTFDLAGLAVASTDQYGDAFALTGNASWQIVTGGDYASLEGSVLTGLVTGNGTVKLVDGEISSNEIPFTVDVVPYVAELYCATDAEYVVEGVAFDLNNITLTAKDQWNNDYVLTQEQLDSIVWEIDPEHSTVPANAVTIDEENETLTVAEGTLDYADTLRINIKATLPDRGDGNGSVASYVELQVRQQQILAEITIGLLNPDKVLQSTENSLVSEFFTISAKDQYGVDYAITTDDVEWACDNDKAFTFRNNAIYAGDIDETGTITVSKVNSINQTITSNGIKMTVPGIEKINAISIEGAPANVKFSTELNVNDLTTHVTSNYNHEYTAEELAAYPALIKWTIQDVGGTGTKLDSSTGQITFGSKRGVVKLVATVVNSANDTIVETIVEINVGPQVIKITPAKATMSASAGDNTITLDGFNMTDGMKVSAFDAEGNLIDTITGTTAGTETKQTVKLTFPKNTDTANAVVYTLRVWIDGEEYDAEPTATVTVNKANAGGGGGGGGGSSLFVIKASAQDGGSISPAGDVKVSSGDNQTFTVAANEGYVISDVLVDGKSVGKVETYTFSKVREAHTIQAVFAKASQFTDVDDDDWYKDSVDYVVDKGLMNGISADLFGPNDPTTRGMIVTVLYRMEGQPAVSGTTAFEDVISGQYYYDPVVWANQNGIVKGVSETAFEPNVNITREQLAAILYRYCDYKGYNVTATADLSKFSDAEKVGDWAVDNMKWAVGAGLIGGNADGTLNPQGQATRAEIATILQRFCTEYLPSQTK